MNCPCLSEFEFAACCEPIITGAKAAETAESLMRARFSAYAQVDMDFVEKSHDPKTRKEFDKDASEEWARDTEWTGLEIISTEKGTPKDSWGKVEFKARYNTKKGEQSHHEISEFNKRSGKWYFTEGKSPESHTVLRTAPKVGRNDPCTCGSGKKFKKCCGSN